MRKMAKNTMGLLVFSVVSFLGMQSASAEDIHPWANFAPESSEILVAQATPVAQIAQIAPRYAIGRRTQKAVPKSVSSMPKARTHFAPGNMALNAVGRNFLPPTRLSSFVEDSGECDDIYGHEADLSNKTYSPIESGFDCQSSEGLTTGHPSDVPSVWAYDTWNK